MPDMSFSHLLLSDLARFPNKSNKSDLWLDTTIMAVSRQSITPTAEAESNLLAAAAAAAAAALAVHDAGRSVTPPTAF